MTGDIRAEIRRHTRPLRIYATVMTVVVGAFSVAAFRGQSARTTFTEIEVQRTKIVERFTVADRVGRK